MNPQRRLVLENIINCRDLGGFPSKYGVTKFGRFLRCAVTAQPTSADLQALKDYGVTTAIDLRGNFEARDMPNNFHEICDNCHHISLYEINSADLERTRLPLEDSYKLIVDEYKENVARILKVIADAPEGAVLYHCFFGKDRTGILTMLLLSIAGVAREDIVADYQQSYTYLYSFIEEKKEVLWDTDCNLHYSLPETMVSLLTHITKKYGSVNGYIKSTGTTEETVEKIRSRFFD